MVHSLNVYNFTEDYKNRPDIICNGLRYLFQWNNKEKSKYNISEDVLRQKSIDTYQRAMHNGDMQTVAEIADMLLQFDPVRGQEFLDNLRNFELKQEKKKLISEGRHREAKLLHVSGKSVYSDSQNVHNSNINKSVLKACRKLWSLYEQKIFGEDFVMPSEEDKKAIIKLEETKSEIINSIEQKLVEIRPFDYEFIHDKCKYIKANTATFGINISIKDIFIALNTWISEQTEQEELYGRLFEELKEMHGLCSSGHLSRFINVMQGYVEDPELIVNISEEDQYTAIIRHYLNKALQQCENEEVIDGIVSGSETYKNFIRQKINEKLLDWEDDYGEEFIKFVPKIVNKFANTEIFKEK